MITRVIFDISEFKESFFRKIIFNTYSHIISVGYDLIIIKIQRVFVQLTCCRNEKRNSFYIIE